jgi:NAD(P)-dependent dehydrogenase (short-subunit alcohol dehydrogenase family)
MTAPFVLITGASRGIGAAVAVRAAARGFDVALNYARNTEAAERVAAQVRAQGRRSLLLPGDVGDEASVLAMFDALDRAWGSPQALVNNAGIVGMKADLVDMSTERLRRMLDVNVLGTLLCAREAVRRMLARTDDATAHVGAAKGAIVNLSSVAAVLGSPSMYVDYAASKGAIDTFTVGLGRELAARGVRVNAVRPGIIDTEIHADSGDAGRAHSSAPVIPMKRPGTAQEVAEAVLWLMSPAASYTTGTILDVTGGR